MAYASVHPQGRSPQCRALFPANVPKTDLDALEEITIENAGRTFVIRSRTRGDAGRALQAAGVALGPTVRFCS